jgi:integrase
MPTAKLTETRIAELRAPDPSGKQVIHWDTETRGLGILCSGTTTSKTFVIQHKLNDGRTRRVTVGPLAIGLRKARAEAATLIAGMLNGKDPKAERRAAAKRDRTLREALEAYLADNAGIAERSRAGYRKTIENYLTDWLDDPIRELTAEMVMKRHKEIAAEVVKRARESVKKSGRGDRRGGGPTTGHATADGVMRALRAVYYHAAVLDPTIPANPVKLKKAWFRVKPRRRTVEFDDLPAFYAAVNALPSRTQRDYVLLLLFTGMRRNEAAALTWDEVKLRERVIKLPDDRIKTKRPLDLPMTDLVHDLFVARRSIGREGQYVFAAGSKSGHIAEPKFAFEQIAEACGVEVTAHDLRRLFTTIANGTVSGRDARALVNHAIGGNVHDDYDMVTVDQLREPAQRVADRLKELCGIDGSSGDNVEKIASR